MTLYSKTCQYATVKPAFRKLLEVVKLTLDHFDVREDREEMSELLLQLRYSYKNIQLASRDVRWQVLGKIIDFFSTQLRMAKIEEPTYSIFVYGTLKRGFPLHRHLTGQNFIAEVRTIPQYRMFVFPNGWYPLLKIDNKEGLSIEGELWEVSETCLHLLDQVEGNGFYRTMIELEPPRNQELVEAYLYKFEVGDDCIDVGSSWMAPEDYNIQWHDNHRFVD